MPLVKNLEGGKSGAAVKLVKESGRLYVRKYLKNTDRDKISIEKQASFSGVLTTPRVLAQNSDYFDQEYVHGATGENIYKYISPAEIKRLTLTIDKYLFALLEQQKIVAFPKHKYLEKIQSLERYCLSGITKKALKVCNDLVLQVDKTMVGPCHGDLTFSNIIINDKIYVIDFLGTFDDGILKDISKLNQELLFGWSCRYFKGNQQLRAKQIRSYMTKNITIFELFQTKYSKQLLLEDLLTLLRIIPYLKNDAKTAKWVTASINTRMDKA